VQGQCTIEQKISAYPPQAGICAFDSVVSSPGVVFASNEKRRAFARRFVSMDARVT
jgi:hypothetical protein